MKLIQLTRVFEKLKPRKQFELESFQENEADKPMEDDSGDAAWYLEKGMPVPDHIYNPDASITFKKEDYEEVEREYLVNSEMIKSLEAEVKHDEFEFTYLEHHYGDVVKVKETPEEIKNLLNKKLKWLKYI